MAGREELAFYNAKRVAVLGGDEGAIALEIETELGTVVRFRIDADDAPQLLSSLAKTVSATIDATATGGPGFVRMTSVSRVEAQGFPGQGGVSLALFDVGGVPHYYTLELPTSAELRTKLRGAETAARSGGRFPKA